MSRYFYSPDDSTRVGPVTLETLRAKAVAGELTPENFVFAEGSAQWIEARLIPGLFNTLENPQNSGVPAVPSRARPATLRPIRSSDYASTPHVRGLPVVRRLYGPPEPCPLRYRATAAVVDAAIVLLVLAILIPIARTIAHALAGPTGADARSLWLATILALTIIPWLYHAGFDCAPWRGTLGKAMFEIRAVTATGSRLTFRRASLRHFARMLSVAPLGAGYLLAWADPHLRTWHDRLTRTAVVRTPPV